MLPPRLRSECGFDIEKIARYVEELPKLGEFDVSKILALFRTGCIERWDVIDPAAPAVRDELNALGSASAYSMLRQLSGRSIYAAADALPALCVTPRALKQALRTCLDTWKRLPGEIDFDDVLILSIVRESQPSAFAAIHDHLHYHREGRFARDEDRRNAQKAWEDAFNSVPMDERSRAAVRCLVELIFQHQRPRENPQGVSQHHHADYWERFLSIPRLDDSEQDQLVLRTIYAEEDAALLDLIQNGAGGSSAVEDFRRLLPTERLVRLFLPLVARRSGERPDSWSDQEPPGLFPLWRMWIRRSEDGQLPSATVLEQLKRALDVAIPHNLSLAATIEEYFVVASPRVHALLGDEERAEAKKHLRTVFAATYVGRGGQLSSSLTGAPVPTLLWLCWGLDQVRSGVRNGLPFEEWAELVPTIVDSVRVEPRVMLPQVACLIVRESRVMADKLETRYDFDQEASERLFGGRETIAGLFAGEDPANWGDSPLVQAVLTHLGKEQDHACQ